MDIQAEKLSIIEKLTHLSDVKVIEKIKALLEGEESLDTDTTISQEEMIERAEISNKDILEGDVTSLEDFKREMKNW